jgi:hypothetical protein
MQYTLVFDLQFNLDDFACSVSVPRCILVGVDVTDATPTAPLVYTPRDGGGSRVKRRVSIDDATRRWSQNWLPVSSDMFARPINYRF